MFTTNIYYQPQQTGTTTGAHYGADAQPPLLPTILLVFTTNIYYQPQQTGTTTGAHYGADAQPRLMFSSLPCTLRVGFF